MAYILGANNQTQAQKFVDHLARITNTSKGSSVVYPSRRSVQTPTTTTQASTGVILGTLSSKSSVTVIYDSNGEYPPGSSIRVSLLSAVYGSYITPGINVVVFRAQIAGVGGTEIDELV